MKTSTLFTALIGLISFVAIEAGAVQIEKPRRFDTVYIEGDHTVTFTQTNRNNGRVSYRVIGAYESYADVYVRDGKLVVKWKDGLPVDGDARIEVEVAAPHLHSVVISGDGSFELEGKFYTDNFRISMDGYGFFSAGNLRATTFEAAVTGGGEVDISDLRTDFARVDLRGEGNVYLKGRARVGTFETLGNGSIDRSGLKVKTLRHDNR